MERKLQRVQVKHRLCTSLAPQNVYAVQGNLILDISMVFNKTQPANSTHTT